MKDYNSYFKKEYNTGRVFLCSSNEVKTSNNFVPFLSPDAQ